MEMCLFFYFCGLFSYVVKGDHVLLMLLSLEFMIIGVFLLVFCGLGMLYGHYYLLLFFIVVVVCESALGLSLLVGVVRSFGSDMVYCYI